MEHNATLKKMKVINNLNECRSDKLQETSQALMKNKICNNSFIVLV